MRGLWPQAWPVMVLASTLHELWVPASTVCWRWWPCPLYTWPAQASITGSILVREAPTQGPASSPWHIDHALRDSWVPSCGVTLGKVAV